jgi:predicted O-methyltransferase YrrM
VLKQLFLGEPSVPRPALLPRDVPDLPQLLDGIEAYRPVFQAEPDAGHRLIAGWPVAGGLIATEPRGFLRPADALTLHDIARHGSGNVLELGSAWGLSTTILCRAVKTRGRGKVVSFEIDPEFQRLTTAAVRKLNLGRWHEMRGGDGTDLLRQAAARGEGFSAIFIDHDHGLEASLQACSLLPDLLAPGGFMLFHDFNDRLNETGEYGVYEAVCRMLRDHPDLALYGIPGCCALVGWR